MYSVIKKQLIIMVINVARNYSTFRVNYPLCCLFHWRMKIFLSMTVWENLKVYVVFSNTRMIPNYDFISTRNFIIMGRIIINIGYISRDIVFFLCHQFTKKEDSETVHSWWVRKRSDWKTTRNAISGSIGEKVDCAGEVVHNGSAFLRTALKPQLLVF